MWFLFTGEDQNNLVFGSTATTAAIPTIPGCCITQGGGLAAASLAQKDHRGLEQRWQRIHQWSTRLRRHIKQKATKPCEAEAVEIVRKINAVQREGEGKHGKWIKWIQMKVTIGCQNLFGSTWQQHDMTNLQSKQSCKSRHNLPFRKPSHKSLGNVKSDWLDASAGPAKAGTMIRAWDHHAWWALFTSSDSSVLGDVAIKQNAKALVARWFFSWVTGIKWSLSPAVCVCVFVLFGFIEPKTFTCLFTIPGTRQILQDHLQVFPTSTNAQHVLIFNIWDWLIACFRLRLPANQ